MSSESQEHLTQKESIVQYLSGSEINFNERALFNVKELPDRVLKVRRIGFIGVNNVYSLLNDRRRVRPIKVCSLFVSNETKKSSKEKNGKELVRFFSS